MARPKSITINLTPTQRAQLRSLTGEDHKQVHFEVTKTAGKKAPVARRMAARSAGKGLKIAHGHDTTVTIGTTLQPVGGGVLDGGTFDPNVG